MFGSNASQHCCSQCSRGQQQPSTAASASARPRQRQEACSGGRDNNGPPCSCQPAVAPAAPAPSRMAGRNSWPPGGAAAGAAAQTAAAGGGGAERREGAAAAAAVAAAAGASGGAARSCRWTGDNDGFVPRPGRSFFAACQPACDCAPPACAPLPVDSNVTGRAGLAQHALMGLYGPPEHLRHHSGLVVRHPTEKKFGYIVPLCVCNCGQFVQGRNGVLLKCRSMLS